jgi:hypothetical protein
MRGADADGFEPDSWDHLERSRTGRDDTIVKDLHIEKICEVNVWSAEEQSFFTKYY